METLKAGCVLIDARKKKVGLVYRGKGINDYTFPKGHLEQGETIKECAARETEEETGRSCRIVTDFEYVSAYTIPRTGEKCKLYMYLAVDEGKTKKKISKEYKEVLIWKDIDEVENVISHQNLKEIWVEMKEKVYMICEGIRE